MKFSKKSAGFILCFFLFVNAFSQSFSKLEEVIPDKEMRNQLLSERKLARFFTIDDNSDFKYFPATEKSREYVKKWDSTRDDKANFILESVYLLPAKEGNSPSEEYAKIEKLIRSISNLEGITYYSQRRRKVCTLYYRAYMINSIEDKQKVKDNLNFNENPVYALFEDNSFGEYTVELNYGSNSKEVFLDYKNREPLGFQAIKAIKPGNMLVFLDVVRCQDDLVVYVFIQAKADVSTIFKNKIYTSFVARADALFQWLKASY